MTFKKVCFVQNSETFEAKKYNEDFLKFLNVQKNTCTVFLKITLESHERFDKKLQDIENYTNKLDKSGDDYVYVLIGFERKEHFKTQCFLLTYLSNSIQFYTWTSKNTIKKNRNIMGNYSNGLSSRWIMSFEV